MADKVKGITPGAVEGYFKPETERMLATFDDDPAQFDKPDEKDAVSFGGTFEHVLNSCGSELVEAAIDHIADAIRQKMDAAMSPDTRGFFAMGFFMHMRERLVKVAGQDKMMDEELKRLQDQWKSDLSAADPTKKETQRDKDVARSATGDDKKESFDRLSRNLDKDAAKKDAEVSDSMWAEKQGKLGIVGQPPAVCYQIASRYLIAQCLRAASGPGFKVRNDIITASGFPGYLEDLTSDSKAPITGMTKDLVVSVIEQILVIGNKLRWLGGEGGIEGRRGHRGTK